MSFVDIELKYGIQVSFNKLYFLVQTVLCQKNCHFSKIYGKRNKGTLFKGTPS